MTINNSEELSKIIKNTAESIENLKILYNNIATSSEASIRSYEKEIRDGKWDIIEYLSNNKNYDNWKNSEQNNSLLFFKYFSKGHFEKEISYDFELKSKINADFKTRFEASPVDVLLTNRERQTLKHYEQNSVQEDRRHKYIEEEQSVKELSNGIACFEKNYNHMQKNLPDSSKISSSVLKAIALIKANPLLLKDHPNHYVSNRDIKKYPSPSTEEFGDIISDATIGDNVAINKVEELLNTFDKLNRKESHKDTVVNTRSKYTKVDSIVHQPKPN